MTTKHLREFEKLNTTTDSIHELGEYSVLIILEDGTNLTSWEDVDNKDKILYVSEDLSPYSNLEGKYKGLTSLKAICASGIRGDVISMKEMFKDCKSLEDISALKSWDVSNVRYMGLMFCGCYCMDDLSALKFWDVSGAISMEEMFNHWTLIEDLSDLAQWDVSNVKEIGGMFWGCRELKDAFAISGWDVSNVEDMDTIFKNCYSIERYPKWYEV